MNHTSATLTMMAAITATAYGEGFTQQKLEQFLGEGRMLKQELHPHVQNFIEDLQKQHGHDTGRRESTPPAPAKEETNSQEEKPVTAKQRLAAARAYWHHMPWFRFVSRYYGGRRLSSKAQAKRAKPIFQLFDSDKNGKIVPKEIFKAYYTIKKSLNPKQELSQKEFKNAMDGSLRKFCGVGPAARNEEDYYNAIFKRRQGRRRRGGQDRRYQRSRGPVSGRKNQDYRYPDNRRQRRNNSRNRRRGQRNQNFPGNNSQNRGGWSQDTALNNNGNGMINQDPFVNQGSGRNVPPPAPAGPVNMQPTTEFDQEITEESFENFGNLNGRGLRSVNNYRSGRKSSGRWGNSRRSRRGQFNFNKNSNNRSGRMNFRKGGNFSFRFMKKLRTRMSAFGLLDTDRNSSLSLFEFFKPFSNADANKDYAVTRAEFGAYLAKHERRICMVYQSVDRKKRQENWFRRGVGASIGKLRPKNNRRNANNRSARRRSQAQKRSKMADVSP